MKTNPLNEKQEGIDSMNTNVKTKINRLGLIGMIISILLIVSTLINFALVTRTSIKAINDIDTNDSYYGVEYKALSAVVAGEDTANRIETDEGVRYNLSYVDGEEVRTFSFTKDGETYKIDVPTSDFTTILFTVENPEKELARLNHLMLFEKAYQIAMIASAAFSVVVFVFLLLAADAFRRCDSPFDDRVIRRMNVFAWILLANALFNLLISIAIEISTRLADPSINVVGALTSSGLFESVLYLVTPSFPLVVSLIVMFLVRIFRHGAELQKESDETL